MVIFTAKLTRKKLAAIVIAIAAILIAVICLAPGFEWEAARTSAGGMRLADISKNISSNEDRISFLNRCGWEVEEEPVDVQNIVIPKEFDEVYKQYNEIQKLQGYDLMKYRGKSATMYTYLIKNYITDEEGVAANLLIYKDKVIGGDVCSKRLDGFMHGLMRPGQR